MENPKKENILKIASNKKIEYMDGLRLSRAIIAGIRYLVSRQDHLNKINVFPVPDGDTGTNMSFTMNSILEVAIGQMQPRVDIFTKNISEAAIDGARGNSGVLIAQYFVGFAEGCEKKEKLDGYTLGKAFEDVKDFEIGDKISYAGVPLGSYCSHRNYPTKNLVKVPDDMHRAIQQIYDDINDRQLGLYKCR